MNKEGNENSHIKLMPNIKEEKIKLSKQKIPKTKRIKGLWFQKDTVVGKWQHDCLRACINKQIGTVMY